MKSIVKRCTALALAAVMLASSLAVSGCAQAPAAPAVSETVVSDADAYKNVPAEYRDLFIGGSFDEADIWITDDEKYAGLITELRPLCDKSFDGSLMVATGDRVIFAGGWAAKETDGETTVNPFTTYEIGSVTKQFCAAAILQQVQAGKMDVNDTLDKYFPDYPYGSQITVDHLLHMDSGVRDMLLPAFFNKDGQMIEAFEAGQLTDEQILAALYQKEPGFEAGSYMEYSNTNYWLLALILEQVSGQSYEDYIKHNIFDVCDMPSSSCCEVGNLTSKPARGDYMHTAYCCRGAGDIHSNVCDILRWNRTLFGGKLLNEEQMEYMTAFRSGYSCGWMDCGYNGIGHAGSTTEYASFNHVFKTGEGEDLYVCLMTGNKGTSSNGMLRVLSAINEWTK